MEFEPAFSMSHVQVDTSQRNKPEETQLGMIECKEEHLTPTLSGCNKAPFAPPLKYFRLKKRHWPGVDESRVYR